MLEVGDRKQQRHQLQGGQLTGLGRRAGAQGLQGSWSIRWHNIYTISADPLCRRQEAGLLLFSLDPQLPFPTALRGLPLPCPSCFWKAATRQLRVFCLPPPPQPPQLPLPTLLKASGGTTRFVLAAPYPPPPPTLPLLFWKAHPPPPPFVGKLNCRSTPCPLAGPPHRRTGEGPKIN